MKYFYCRISIEWEYTENITLKLRIWNSIHLEFATRKRYSNCYMFHPDCCASVENEKYMLE